jgi:excisionase family DNA binding protein
MPKRGPKRGAASGVAVAKPATETNEAAVAAKPTPRKRPLGLTLEELQRRVMVRPREFAELTGTPLPTVYKYIATGQLKASRMGSTLRIPVSEIR